MRGAPTLRVVTVQCERLHSLCAHVKASSKIASISAAGSNGAMQPRLGTMIEGGGFVGCNDRTAFQLGIVDAVFRTEIFNLIDRNLGRLAMSLFPAVDRGKTDTQFFRQFRLTEL